MEFLLLEDPKFSPINCLTNIFLQLVPIHCTLRYIFQRQAVQKGRFPISELVHIRFSMHINRIKATVVALACA